MSTETETTWVGETPPQRPYLLAHAAVVVVLIVAMSLEGRVWFCGCGSWNPVVLDINSQHCSQHVFDAYSTSHVLHGVLIFGGLWLWRGRISAAWRLWGCLLIESAWEVLENSPLVIDRYRTATIALGYTGDSITNSLSDLACCLGGYLLASAWSWRQSVVFFVAVELLMVWSIKDSLVLNVVMLVWPLEAIKRWQLGGDLFL